MKKAIILLLISWVNIIVSQEVIDKRKPLSVQIDSAKIVAQDFLDDHDIPGMAVSVSVKDSLIFSEGFGLVDITDKMPVIPGRTQFRIASISKSLTAMALGVLKDAGKLDFDESIYTYLPDYPKHKYDFTIRQVAGHTAGIRHYKGPEFISNKKMTITEGLDIFKNDTLMYPPGTNYLYSTYGWNLLSEVVQRVAEVPFDDFMHRRIFDPLKMDRTALEYADSTYADKTAFYRKTNAGDIVPGLPVNNEFKAAGGGYLSTSEDLVRFGNEVLHPTIVQKSTLKDMLTPQTLPDGSSTGYGVGLVIDKSVNETRRYSHSGGGVGATALLLMYPEEYIVIAILMNVSNAEIRELATRLEAIFLKDK